MAGLKPTRLDKQKIQHRPAHDRERSPRRNVYTNHAWVSTTFRSCRSFALAAVSEPDPKCLLPSAGMTRFTAWGSPKWTDSERGRRPAWSRRVEGCRESNHSGGKCGTSRRILQQGIGPSTTRRSSSTSSSPGSIRRTRRSPCSRALGQAEAT